MEFEQGEDGALVEEHEVDACVTLCLGWPKGSIKGDPTTGHTLQEVNMGESDEVRHRDVAERQAASIKHLIDKGLVSIESVEDEVNEFGRLSVQTSYKNLVTSKSNRVTSG